MVLPEGIESLTESDEVCRDEASALMDQLVETVLPVSAGLSPEDRASVVVNVRSIEAYMFAVGFHRQLLKISGEPLEVLLVGQNCDCLGIEEVGVPEAQ